MANLEREFQESFADNQRLQETNQTNTRLLGDVQTQQYNTDREYTTLRNKHIVLKGQFRDADKHARHAQHKLQKIMDRTQ